MAKLIHGAPMTEAIHDAPSSPLSGGFGSQERELTAEEAVELERERDRDERDALVERMMDKDKSKTKQMELGGLTPAQVRRLPAPPVVVVVGRRRCR